MKKGQKKPKNLVVLKDTEEVRVWLNVGGPCFNTAHTSFMQRVFTRDHSLSGLKLFKRVALEWNEDTGEEDKFESYELIRQKEFPKLVAKTPEPVLTEVVDGAQDVESHEPPAEPPAEDKYGGFDLLNPKQDPPRTPVQQFEDKGLHYTGKEDPTPQPQPIPTSPNQLN